MRTLASVMLSASLACPNPVLARPPQVSGNPSAQQAPAAATVKQPLAFGLEDGTPVRLRLTRTISSADAQVNDTVDFEVLEEVKVHGAVVIPRGGTAWGTVTEAQRKRRMGRGGKLNVNIDNVLLTSGEKVPLRAVKDTQGGGHVGAMTGAIVATSIVFFPAAPLFLLIHGKDITIPKGTEITAYINGDVPLEPGKFGFQGIGPARPADYSGQPAGMASAAQPGIAVAGVLCTVEVKSVPDGADISVDGKYMGSTPSTLRLAGGDHKVKVEKRGYKSWERTLTVVGGEVATVNATLDKQGQ